MGWLLIAGLAMIGYLVPDWLGKDEPLLANLWYAAAFAMIGAWIAYG